MCSNCYNGCTEITSDQCVRYTGVDVPVLGIKNGDSLSYVEQAIVTFLTSTLDGTGIKPTIPSEIICSLVQSYLPTCEDITEVDLFKALIQSICSLQTQVTSISNTLSSLNSGYTTSCLSGVDNTSSIKQVIQAIISKVCANDTSLTALALDVSTNYVKLENLNTLIQAYLDSIAPANFYYTKMIPFTAVEYYGSLANFDATGAGLSQWVNIYLCNGLNGTPDKRGRVPVGAISGVPGPTPDSAVNPASSPFNPNYSLNSTAGTNSVTLTTSTIPSHSHSITDVSHSHLITKLNTGTSNGGDPNNSLPIASMNDDGITHAYILQSELGGDADAGKTTTVFTGINGTNNTGTGDAHDNKQPAIACYYIMYIP